MRSLVKRYRLLGEIGRGAFTSVFQAVHIDTGCRVAVKLIRKTSDLDMSKLRREVDALSQTDHPNILTMYEVEEDDDCLILVCDFIERGSLKEKVEIQGHLDEKRAKQWFVSLVNVVSYLHTEAHIVHRDLKADNILIDDSDNIKLADFGLCNFFSEKQPLLKTNCGTPTHVSPEVIRGQPYGPQTDIWSMGVILYYMLTGLLPFVDTSIMGCMRKVLETEPSYPRSISPMAKDLISRLLRKDPKDRLTLAEIKTHPWLADVYAAPTGYRKIDDCIAAVVKLSMEKSPLTEAQIRDGFKNGVFDASMATPRILLQRMRENPNRYRDSPCKALGDTRTPVKNVMYDTGCARMCETLDIRRRVGRDLRRKGNTLFMFNVAQRRGIPQAASVPRELFQV